MPLPSQPPSSVLSPLLGLAPHISTLNALSLVSSATISISLLVFLNAAQPFLLTILHVPSDQAGALTGRLISYDQVCALGLALVWGAVADRVGVRFVVPVGYALVGAGLGGYAGARGVGLVIAWRILFAVSELGGYRPS